MGRATIISGGTDGRYTIEIDTGETERLARVADLTARVATLTAELAAATAAYNATQAPIAAQAAVVSSTIDALAAAMNAGGDPATWAAETKAHQAALAQLLALQAAARPLQIRRDLLTLQLAQANKDLGAWSALSLLSTRQAWCTDYTEDGAGLVGTIDVNSEGSLVLIGPGCAAPGAGDGRLVSTAVQSPEQMYWNLAALPGFQKWKPTYRTGVITALDTDADTADVTLDAATSSQQALDINQAPTALAGVPVEYMECNAAVFEEGDRCVVRFYGQDWTSPRVIGFVDNPRPCIEWPVDLWMLVYVEIEDEPTVGPLHWVYYGEDIPNPPCAATPQYYNVASSGSKTHRARLGSISLGGTDFTVSGAPYNQPAAVIWEETVNAHYVNMDLPDATRMWAPTAGGAGKDYFLENYAGVAVAQYDKSFPGPNLYQRYVYLPGYEPECQVSDSQMALDSSGPVIKTYKFGPYSHADLVQELGAFVNEFTLTWRGSVSKTYRYAGTVDMGGSLGRLVYEPVED